MNTRGNRTWSWLGHPVTLVALAVLVVNDHVLKGLWPGPVTGKLSDAAGLVVAPPLLALIVRRPAVALWSVGAGFFLVKAFPYAAELASAAWSLCAGPSLVRADPTDLLTLPFLAVAGWAHRRATPHASRWVRALRVAVVLPLALTGVAATSAVRTPFAENVTSTADEIHLTALSSPPAVVSRDNGLTWIRALPAPTGQATRPCAQNGTDPTCASPGGPDRTLHACSGTEPLVCYRVVPGALGVERSQDGGRTWSVDWRVSEPDRRLLARHYPDVGPFAEDLSSLALAVHDRRSGGHVVLVANGRDGFAMRDPEGGWRRIGFPLSSHPMPALGEPTDEQKGFELGAMISTSTLLLGLVVLVGGAVAAGRTRNRRSLWWLAPGLLTAGSVLLTALAHAGVDAWPLAPLLLVSPAAIVVSAVALAITVTAGVVTRGPDRGRWALATWTAGLLTAALALGVWLVPGPVGPHLLASAVCLLPGVVLAGLAARRIPTSTYIGVPGLPQDPRFDRQFPGQPPGEGNHDRLRAGSDRHRPGPD